MNAKAVNYDTVKDDVLRHMWLEDEKAGYTVHQISAAMEISDYVARRTLKLLTADGLLSHVKGSVGRVSTEMGECRLANNRERFARLLVLQERPLLYSQPDRWTLTEQGLERVMVL